MEGGSAENQAHRGTALRDKPVLTDTDARTDSVARGASTCSDSEAEDNGQNLVAEPTVSGPCLVTESPVSDPCLHPESPVTDPCLDPESAASDPCLHPESPVTDPCLDPESAASDPCLGPESAVSDPCLESAVSNPCLDPESAVSDPCLGPESAVSDPCLESAVSDPCLDPASPTRSSALSFSDRPPDGGWGWVIVAAALACHTLLEGFPRALGVLFQPTIRVFDGNNAETAVHQSIFNTLRMVLGPVASILCSRYGCRPVICCGGAVFAVGVMLGGFSSNLTQLNLSVGVIAGVGGALIFTPNYIAIGEYFDRNKGKAMSVATVGTGLGAFVMPALWMLVFSQYGYFGAMFIMGAVYLNNVVAGAMFRPLRPRYMEKVTKTSSINSAEDDCRNNCELEKKEMKNNLNQGPFNTEHRGLLSCCSACQGKSMLQALMVRLSLFGNLGFISHALTMVCIPFCLQATVMYLPSWGSEQGIPPRYTALLVMLTGVGDIAGRLTSGFIFDLPIIKPRRLLVYKLFCLAFGFITVMVSLCTSISSLVTVALIWGLFEACCHGQRITVVSEFVSPDQMSDAVGILIFFQGVGNFIAPLISGLLKDRFDTYRFGFIVNGVCMLVAGFTGLIYVFYIAKHLNKNTNQNDLTK